jgi:uncharacterized protein
VTAASSLSTRIAALDWDAIGRDMDAFGHAITAPLLTGDECEQIVAMYDDAARWRSVIDMQRHGFGSGEYKYFAAPLPAPIAEMRTTCYPPLARIANGWAQRLRTDSFPETLDEFLARCHAAGQDKPTPLVLHYRAGDYNALHQDVYGEIGFPLQVLSVLSPTTAYDGGEVLLVTQRPRQQSVGDVIGPPRGALVVFPNRYRPVAGRHGDHRVTVRHGVSRLRAGDRYSLGIIFHDA